MKKFKKILLYDFSEDTELIRDLSKYSEEIDIIIASDDYQNKLTKDDFEGVDCFVVNVFDNFRNEFFVGSNVKVIFTMFTDNSMFDLEFLKQNQIDIYNITGQAAQGVCEYAISVLLNKIKMTHASQEFSKSGGTGFMDFKGTEIYEKQVGIIGYGSLGQHFKKIMKGFGAIINYFSKSSHTSSLEQIFSHSDIIFISSPFSESFERYDVNLLSSCKENTFILNPSRIELFHLSDLYDFLLGRKDCVFWQDESMTDEWAQWKEKFLKLDNFILTPHCGFFTKENPKRVKKLTLKNIKNYETKK